MWFCSDFLFIMCFGSGSKYISYHTWRWIILFFTRLRFHIGGKDAGCEIYIFHNSFYGAADLKTSVFGLIDNISNQW